MINRGNSSTRSPEITCSDLICSFWLHVWGAWDGTETNFNFGTVLGTQLLVLAVARLSRELGENSPSPPTSSPPRPTQTVLFSKIVFLIAGVSLIPSIIASPPPSSCPYLISSPQRTRIQSGEAEELQEGWRSCSRGSESNPNYHLVNKLSRISPHKFLRSWLINTVYHLLVKNKYGKGSVGLIEMGEDY